MEFVNYSSEDSREKRVYSKLAIVESIIFAFVPWILYIFFDFAYSLLIPILVAPLLLLKTKESVEVSHKIFLYTIKIKNEKKFRSLLFWILCILGFLISVITTHYLLKFIPQNENFFLDLMLGILLLNIVFLLAIVIAGNAYTYLVVSGIIGSFMVLSFWTLSLSYCN